MDLHNSTILSSVKSIEPAAGSVSTGSRIVEFLNSAQTAELLGLSPRTLEAMRIDGRGPPFNKFGRAVRYSRSGTLKWAAEQSRTSTSDEGPVAA